MQSELLHNNWFGKAVGATCGWIWAPTDPLWLAVAVITGIGCGHVYDMLANHYRDDDDTASLNKMAASHREQSSPHMQFLFAALGRVAKISGPVSPVHIAYVEKLITQMGLDASSQAQAKAWFKQGKLNSYSSQKWQKLSQECLQASEQGTASRLTILRCLCTITSLRADDNSLSCLKQLGGYLGFAPSRIAREFGDIHKASEQPSDSSSNSDSGASTASPNSDLTRAFSRLNVAPGASSDKVKLAYRKLVSKYHPDKLPRNAPTKDKQAAQHTMVELRDALELIQSHQR